MRLLLSFSMLVLGAAPAWAAPSVVTVDLSNFRFAPAALELPANAEITLRLRNAGGGGHSFSAPAFFAAARVDPASAAKVRSGRVEVRGRQTVDIVVTPAAGTYRLTCSHLFHGSLGMKGNILVR